MRVRSVVVATVVVFLLVVAAVSSVAAAPGGTNGSAPADPETDALGWEDGRWHDEPLAVDPTDGLNDTELNAVRARSMARVEEIR